MAGRAQHPRDRWMTHYGHDETIRRFRDFRVDPHRSVGQMLGDFCTEWERVQHLLPDWEVAHQFCRMLPIPWRVWVRRLIEDLRWTEEHTMYQAIDFGALADRIFHQWWSERAPPNSIQDFRAAREERLAERRQAGIETDEEGSDEQEEEAREDAPIIQISDSQPFSTQPGAHDAEVRPSRIRQTSEDPPLVNSRRVRRRLGMRAGVRTERVSLQIRDVTESDFADEDDDEDVGVVPVTQPPTDGHLTDWSDDDFIQLTPMPSSGFGPAV